MLIDDLWKIAKKEIDEERERAREKAESCDDLESVNFYNGKSTGLLEAGVCFHRFRLELESKFDEVVVFLLNIRDPERAQAIDKLLHSLGIIRKYRVGDLVKITENRPNDYPNINDMRPTRLPSWMPAMEKDLGKIGTVDWLSGDICKVRGFLWLIRDVTGVEDQHHA